MLVTSVRFGRFFTELRREIWIQSNSFMKSAASDLAGMAYAGCSRLVEARY